MVSCEAAALEELFPGTGASAASQTHNSAFKFSLVLPSSRWSENVQSNVCVRVLVCVCARVHGRIACEHVSVHVN